jgi:pre-rRNA-processing protein TSR4
MCAVCYNGLEPSSGKLKGGCSYELGGKPLPFASDRVFDQLFPFPPPPTLPLTKGTFTVAPRLVRCYQPEYLPHCPFCGSKRVFECQLMPNLLNVLAQDKEGDTGKQMTAHERVREVAKLLRGGHDMNDKVGMEWGTCMIFSCGKDCSEETECWREEVVLVQWDE